MQYQARELIDSKNILVLHFCVKKLGRKELG